MYFIIVLEDVADNFTVRDVKLSFFDSDCFDEALFAVFVFSLFLFDFPIGLFDVWEPICHFPASECRAEYVDACIGGDFESDSGHFFSVHDSLVI